MTLKRKCTVITLEKKLEELEKGKSQRYIRMYIRSWPTWGPQVTFGRLGIKLSTTAKQRCIAREAIMISWIKHATYLCSCDSRNSVLRVLLFLCQYRKRKDSSYFQHSILTKMENHLIRLALVGFRSLANTEQFQFKVSHYLQIFYRRRWKMNITLWIRYLVWMRQACGGG